MIIIIEGLDRTGKSTQIRLLSEHLKSIYGYEPFIHHDKGSTSETESFKHYDTLCDTFMRHRTVLLDRFHLGECVYPKLYKNYNGEKNFRYIDTLLHKKFGDEVLLILLHDSNINNLLSRDDGDALGGDWPNTIKTEYECFKSAFNNSMLNKVEIDINEKSIDDVHKEILCYINKFIPKQWDNHYDNNCTLMEDVISVFAKKLKNNSIEDNGTIEILNANFALHPTYTIDLGVFKTNEKYTKQELDWYLSQSLSINGYVDNVKIWNECASKDDKKEVNSNYGYLVFSEANGSQFENAKKHLLADKSSRNAIIVYNRPSIHEDMYENGKHDMICTMYSQFFIRNNTLQMKNDMRSNDFIFGFFNDFYWASYIYFEMYNELVKSYPGLEVGRIHWNASSLHVYPRHFNLIKRIYIENI